MKKLVFPIFCSMLLSSCSLDNSFGGLFGFSSLSSSFSSSESSVDSFDFSGNVSSESSIGSLNSSESINSGSYSSSSEMVSSSSIYYSNRFVNLYAIYDFHGATEYNSSSYERGIMGIGTFLKEKGKEDNTLILNSGDMWQGSIHSNVNYGKLLTDIMNDVEFDCFTLGNHEFDWGQKYILENRSRVSSSGYQTPFLAANVYKYNIDTGDVLEYAELGDKYVIRELENGLKVGIIGVIGKDQITSISSQFVDDLTFIDPIPVIKDLSNELRVSKGCDVVIVDAHTDEYSITNSSDNYFEDNAGITSVSSVSNRRYVDAVFCAHTHKNVSKEINGVPFLQASCNGKAYNYASLKVDSSGNVSCSSKMYTYSSKIDIDVVDESIEEIYTEYWMKSNKIGSEVLGSLNGSLEKSGDNNVANLVTASIGDYAFECGYDIDYAVCNGGRDNLSSGNLTYEKLFKAIPFDNVVYIARVSGYDLNKSLKSNYFCRYDSDAIDVNGEYVIAIIDYLLFHRNSNRQYNYFSDIDVIDYLKKGNNNLYNYREITANYIRNKKSITAGDYSSSSDRHSRSLIGYDISL